MATLDVGPTPTMLVSPYRYKLGRPLISSTKATKKAILRLKHRTSPWRDQPLESLSIADPSSQSDAGSGQKTNDERSAMPFDHRARKLAPFLTHDDFATTFASSDNSPPCNSEDRSSSLYYVASSYRYKKLRKLNIPGVKRYRMRPGDGFSGDEARPTGMILKKKRFEPVTHLGMLELVGPTQRPLSRRVLSIRRRMDCGLASAYLANFTLRGPVSQMQPVNYLPSNNEDRAPKRSFNRCGEVEEVQDEVFSSEMDMEHDRTTECQSPIIPSRVLEGDKEPSPGTVLGQKGVKEGSVDERTTEGRHNTAELGPGSTWMTYEVSDSEDGEWEPLDLEVQTTQSLEAWSSLLRSG